jgi:nitrite reductase/ring-hydroxylating ferredoxin subunit
LSGNLARPAAGTTLCKLDEIPDPGAKGRLFRAGDQLFLGFLVRRGSAVFGYVDRCPHAGMPLAAVGDRYLTRRGDAILCANHGALFRLSDGVCTSGPCAGLALMPWPVRVRDGDVVAA